tara:strand:+ start:40332 stop:41951 length:1620 start_codon:yes stop_codon:yes gene_type:complete
MKAICSGILILLATFTGFLFLSFSDIDEVQSTWSEPKLLYVHSIEPGPGEFQADVHDETIHIVGGYRLLREGRFFEDSKIFYLQQEIGSEPEVLIFPTDNYPSERPSLLRDHSGDIHFLWGDRRMDPEFEEWKIERPQALGFSTHVIYSRYDGKQVIAPESIYEGHLRELVGGIGDIFLPASWVEDEEGHLHTVFVADSTFKATYQGEEVTSYSPGIAYMIRSEGEWSPRRFLRPGVQGEIALMPHGILIIGYLGSTGGNINDVLVLTSDDSGETWSEPNPVFLSGQQPGRFLDMKTGSDGSVHLIWGRQTRGIPVPNELWHSYSEDNGSNWSEPERFLKLDQPPVSEEKIIGGYDFVLDHNNRLHCIAVEIGLSTQNRTLNYGIWDPHSKKWTQEETPQVDEVIRSNVNLTIDETTNKMYFFWDDDQENAIYYVVKELDNQVLPPPISSSGPLKLYANHPNPFNSSTQITFTLKESAEVEIKVYDMSGRQIMQKNLGERPVGTYAEEVNLNTFSSGTYIYEIALNGTWRQQSTMMYIK